MSLFKNSKIKIYKTTLLVVKHGLILIEECRVRIFENRILRRIFGPKRDENWEWRILHNEELQSLCRSHNIVRKIKSTRLRWASYVVRMEEGRSDFKILTRKLQERDL